MNTSSLLIEQPKTYAHWWTFVPVLPPDRASVEYRMLERQWHDHTMNCLKKKNGLWELASSRGFYVERREDHIATVLFHIWALFPDSSWVGPLLDLLAIPHGRIARAQWSYSWEQKQSKSARPDIVDILLCYEDDQGQGVLVIEAKRPGGKLSEKDRDGGRRYLQMPSLRPIERKNCVFIVDERDRANARLALPPTSPVTSWQKIGRLQAVLAADLLSSSSAHVPLAAYVARHYNDLGMPLGAEAATELSGIEFTGKQDRYDAMRRLELPNSVERFLLGSEASFCARSGVMPQPPFPWLADEPSFVEIVMNPCQSTAERGLPLWRLP